MEDAEAYTSDHIAFRDQWVSMQSFLELISGKQENGGTYFAQDGTLINRVEEPEVETLRQQVEELNQFASSVEVPLYLGIIPSAASVWEEKLPEGAPTADEASWTEYLYEQLCMECIDMASALRLHAAEPIYYRTDHHWTSLGAFYGANSILEALGLPQLELADYEPVTVTEAFYGTTWSSSCAWWVEPDSMEIYVSEDGVEVTSNFTGKDVAGQLYVSDQLETKNKYAYFLGGNQPLCVVRSESDGPRILVFRDS